MSTERRRAREARQRARAAEVAAAAHKRDRAARRADVRDRLVPTPPRRRRRYGALSRTARYRLVVVFVGVQAVAWLLLDRVGPRLAVAVLTLAALTVVTVTRPPVAR